MLTPEQQRRALEASGLAFRELTLPLRQAFIQIQYEQQRAEERIGGKPSPIRPEDFTNAVMTTTYLPAGWYRALVSPESVQDPSWNGPMGIVTGRTAEEVTAAARRVYPKSAPPKVQRSRDGYFIAGITFYNR
jgi:hypothetical protein